MQLRKSVGMMALAAANTHIDAEELGPLSVDGPFLVFTFPDDLTVDQANVALREMDKYVGGLIADSDDNAEIDALSQLKATIVGIGRDVVREIAYKNRASVSEEATTTDAGSQLHGEQHASITDSSNSDGADSNQPEEVSEDGQALEPEQEQQRPRRRRG